jgi:hypothetical protein
MAPPFVTLIETGSLAGKVSSTARSSFSSRLRFGFSGSLLALSGMMMLRFEVYRGTGHCCTRSELDRPSRRKLASSVVDDQRMTAREEEPS